LRICDKQFFTIIFQTVFHTFRTQYVWQLRTFPVLRVKGTGFDNDVLRGTDLKEKSLSFALIFTTVDVYLYY